MAPVYERLTGSRFHKALVGKAKIVTILNHLNPPVPNGELDTWHEMVIIQFASIPSFYEVINFNAVRWAASPLHENRKDLSG